MRLESDSDLSKALSQEEKTLFRKEIQARLHKTLVK